VKKTFVHPELKKKERKKEKKKGKKKHFLNVQYFKNNFMNTLNGLNSSEFPVEIQNLQCSIHVIFSFSNSHWLLPNKPGHRVYNDSWQQV
jgi:hypothetical protein